MKKFALLLPLSILFGCANPISGGLNNLRTSVRNGFQDMKIEVSPVAAALAKFDELKLQASLDNRFDLTGYVTHGKSCKNFLSLSARFYSADGSVLGATPGMAKAYRAEERAKFRASFKQIARDRTELISKVVIEDVKCL